ncbi:MAG TPA: hypothetical protein H9946_08315 [Candidatus Jeotgalibaca pullicola]|nr:hypothetical protein [Candidatus Jeotgalibaca pullicola]
MENYYDNHFLSAEGSRSTLQSALPVSIHSELTNSVMPLYQIIRFANQAAINKKKVSITIEKKLGHNQYTRQLLTGTFNSKLNKNKQIAFKTAENDMVHLLKIDQILAIQQI